MGIPADPLIGTSIGNYTLVARLGSGGMGDVYHGVHPVIGAQVAIKILQTSSGDREAAHRFMLEARVGNEIEHPAVIKVIDAGQLADGRPYLVMPLLDGQPLDERMAAAPRLPIDEACRIAIEMLEALAAAHARNVVHRDLKPANVFLVKDRRVVILDFGIAKLIGDARLTMTGAALGTPHYMAPEQIQQHGLGPWTDIYGVGVVLYEMLCGRVPFTGDSAFAVMEGHLERRPPPPRSLRPEIPTAVQEVVLQALAKPIDRRYSSATAMRDALALAAPGAVDPRRPSRPSVPPGAVAAARGSAPPARGRPSVPPPEPSRPPALSDAATVPGRRIPADPDTVPDRSPAPASAARAAAVPRRSLARAAPLLAVAMVATVAIVVIAIVATGGDQAQPNVTAAAMDASARATAATGGGPDAAPAAVPAVTVDAPLAAPVDAASGPGRRPTGTRPGKVGSPDARPTPPTPTAASPDARRIEIEGSVHVTFPGESEAGVGGVELATVPAGATLSIDGKRKGKTPWKGELPAGDHVIELKRHGYATETHTIQIVADNVVEITLGMHVP